MTLDLALTQRDSLVTLSDFERRAEHFARTRALILKIVNSMPGLTVEEISKEFVVRYGFLPRIENRLRELVKDFGFVEQRVMDGRLHFYPKEEASEK